MLDIAELLKARKSEFISLRELIVRIHLHQPHITLKDIADFIYIENSNEELPEWVKRGIAGTIEPTYVDDNYESDCSLTSLLSVIHDEGCIPEVFTYPPEPSASAPMEFDDDIPF